MGDGATLEVLSVGPRGANLLLGESGYAFINPPEWIASLRPQLAILSVAAADKNGLPDAASRQVKTYTSTPVMW